MSVLFLFFRYLHSVLHVHCSYIPTSCYKMFPSLQLINRKTDVECLFCIPVSYLYVFFRMEKTNLNSTRCLLFIRSLPGIIHIPEPKRYNSIFSFKQFVSFLLQSSIENAFCVFNFPDDNNNNCNYSGFYGRHWKKMVKELVLEGRRAPKKH